MLTAYVSGQVSTGWMETVGIGLPPPLSACHFAACRCGMRCLVQRMRPVRLVDVEPVDVDAICVGRTSGADALAWCVLPADRSAYDLTVHAQRTKVSRRLLVSRVALQMLC